MNPSRPLQGLRVLEIGSVIAAPFCASLLADLGACIIKIERPGGGDSFRFMGPKVEGVPLWWGVAARNKLCVTMDLKDADDRTRFVALVQSADLIVENNRPGVMDRLGFGFADLSRLNPGVIVLSISGFGGTGPYAGRAGFGKIGEAMSGQLMLTGAPDAAPYHVGFSLADTLTGLTGLFGLSVALFVRDSAQCGGSHIDVALYEPLLRMLDCQFALTELTGQSPRRNGSNNPYGWGHRDENTPDIVGLKCSDGAWITVLVDHVAAIALSGEDTIAGLRAMVEERDCEQSIAELTALGIPAARVHDGETLAADPYFAERGEVEFFDHPAMGRLAVPGRSFGGYSGEGLNAFRTPGLAPRLGPDDELTFASVDREAKHGEGEQS